MTSNIYHSDEGERCGDVNVISLLGFEVRTIDSPSGKNYQYKGSNTQWKVVPNFLEAEPMVQLIEIMRKRGWLLRVKTMSPVTRFPYAVSFTKKEYEGDWALGYTLQRAVKEAALKALVKEKEYAK